MEEYIKHDVFGKSVLFDELDIHWLNEYELAYRNRHCPICTVQLSKIPKVRGKCVYCNKNIHARVSPFNSQSLLVDDEGTVRLNDLKKKLADRRFIYKMIDTLQLEDKQFTDIQLRKKATLSNESYSKLLIDEFYKHISINYEKYYLGLMRNNFMHIAFILKRFDSVETALQAYFTVMFIDVLGYDHSWYYAHQITLTMQPKKHLKFSFVAPAILSDTKKLIKAAHCSDEQLYQYFLDGIQKIPFRIDNDDISLGWHKIKDAIDGKSQNTDYQAQEGDQMTREQVLQVLNDRRQVTDKEEYYNIPYQDLRLCLQTDNKITFNGVTVDKFVVAEEDYIRSIAYLVLYNGDKSTKLIVVYNYCIDEPLLQNDTSITVYGSENGSAKVNGQAFPCVLAKLICKHNTKNISADITLNDLLSDLDSLIGLNVVKQDVHSMINLIKIRKIREQKGLRIPEMSNHLVFCGNPGTGKTTVARLLAGIYYKMGLLSKGHLVETDRAGLVAGYVGQTALKTKEVLDSAKGGILFIDEAYTLASSQESDFGREAIDTILKYMEDNRDDFIVIVAGYPDRMQTFINSNPGLQSRFNKYINFDDYSADELMQIFQGMCQKADYILSDRATEYISGYFQKIVETKPDNFSNGRFVRNCFEKVITNQANRLSTDTDIGDDELQTIEYDDVCII